MIFRLGGIEKQSAVLPYCRYDPEFDEEFIFKLSDMFTEKLQVIVRDNSANQKLGECNLSLSHLYEDIEEERWYTLDGSNGRLLIELMVSSAL